VPEGTIWGQATGKESEVLQVKTKPGLRSALEHQPCVMLAASTIFEDAMPNSPQTDRQRSLVSGSKIAVCGMCDQKTLGEFLSSASGACSSNLSRIRPACAKSCQQKDANLPAHRWAPSFLPLDAARMAAWNLPAKRPSSTGRTSELNTTKRRLSALVSFQETCRSPLDTRAGLTTPRRGKCITAASYRREPATPRGWSSRA
jgi:hypothetical protein